MPYILYIASVLRMYMYVLTIYSSSSLNSSNESMHKYMDMNVYIRFVPIPFFPAAADATAVLLFPLV